jgi:DNA-binding NarL/FixJ family response regulator
MIDVQIVDDHTLLTEGLRLVINESGIANVSNVYSNLESARKGLELSQPDVLLLDVELPDGDGVEFSAEILALYPDLKILMLTGFKEFSIARRALLNGASGYIVKNALSEEVLDGIQKVYDGEQYICEEIEVLLRKHRKEQPIRLTSREKDVLKLIALGLSNAEIGEQLDISWTTVKGYRQNMLLKFNTDSSLAMVVIAKEQKLI